MRSLVYFMAAVLISICGHFAVLGLYFIPENKSGGKKNTVSVALGISFENLVEGPPITVSKSDYQKHNKSNSTLKPTSGQIIKKKVISGRGNTTHIRIFTKKMGPSQSNSKVFYAQNNMSEHNSAQAFITTFKPKNGSSILSGLRAEKIIGGAW